jgi:hypothetical protein
LSAYNIAIDRTTTDNSVYSKRIEFIKFTTADETTIRFGVRLFYALAYVEIDPSRLPVSYTFNAEDLFNIFLTPKYDYIKSANDDQNIFIENFGYGYGQLKVNIFGGLNKGSKSEKKPYTSPIYSDTTFVELMNKIGVGYNFNNYYKYLPRGKERSVYLKSLQFAISWRRDDEATKADALAKMKEVFTYIYEKQPFMITVQSGGGLEAIKGKMDVYKVKDGEEEIEVEAEGVEYPYQLAEAYDVAIPKLNQYAKFKRYEKTDRGYGNVYLNRRATVLEATSYRLYPLEPTPKTMIKYTLSLLSDAEKLKFSQDLRKMIADGEPDVQIGIYITGLVYGKVLSAKNIFGLYANDLEYVGQLFKDYAQGKIEDAKLPEKKAEAKDEEAEGIEPKALTFDTAQDFMIELLSKTR